MNKGELIDTIAGLTGASKTDTKTHLDATLATMMDCFVRGDDVNLVGFGTLKVIKRKGRLARNPRTGEEVTIPDRKEVKFVAGKALRGDMNA